MTSRQQTTHTEPAGGTGTDIPITVRELRQSYGDFEAVRGVSFDVARGELFALLGTNGAGKTTTIETLEGFRQPSSGTVRVFGTNPYGQPGELRERVDAVLQHSGVFDELTVAETVDLSRDLAADPLDRDTVLDTVGLVERAGVTVRQLSGGEKRRLDLGLAVLSQPEVLFLDEPTAGMDPEARRATWRVIEDLVAGGVAVLLTTHYLEEAERLADRIAIMHAGEIRVSGRIHEVLTGWGDRLGFRIPDGLRLDDLPDLPDAAAETDIRQGEPWVSYVVTGDDTTGRAHRAMVELLDWARHHDITLRRLELRSAALEDVFLSVAAQDGLAALG